MGTYTFQWPHAGEEVFVTGTFDDWKTTVKLEKTEDGFKKDVELPNAEEKVLYKFVVDGTWTTDHTAPQEADADNNTNNILLPADIRRDVTPEPAMSKEGDTTAGIMSSVTPESTTAALAADVPKESSNATEATITEGEVTPEVTKPAEPETIDSGVAAISSAAPDSTTADLAKDVPVEDKSAPPGTFPETPAKEPDQFAVNPIPATAGVGNPIHLNPGDKVPDPSTITNNTVGSNVTTDQASYEKDASAAGFAPPDEADTPITTLPVEKQATNGTVEPFVQSAAPTSTTAALAAAVPLEKDKAPESEAPAEDVPEVVKESLSEAHKEPEAAANTEAVEEKREVEEELLKEVPTEEPESATAPGVPGVVTRSLSQSHGSPEAAANAEAVEEKREVEEELLQEVPTEEPGSATAPGVPAVVTRSLSQSHGMPEAAANAEAVDEKKEVEEELLRKVPTEEPESATAPGVPAVVTQSLSQSHGSPEAASNEEAVVEKKEVEEELLKEVKHDESVGEPAPTTAAATSATAPAPTEPAESSPAEKKEQEQTAGDVSPKTQVPADASAEPVPEQPTLTTGPEVTPIPATSVAKEGPETAAPAVVPAETAPATESTEPAAPSTEATTTQPKTEEALKKEKKKKNRASGFFAKLKEKFK